MWQCPIKNSICSVSVINNSESTVLAKKFSPDYFVSQYESFMMCHDCLTHYDSVLSGIL